MEMEDPFQNNNVTPTPSNFPGPENEGTKSRKTIQLLNGWNKRNIKTECTEEYTFF
jgi:hypothetical protein